MKSDNCLFSSSSSSSSINVHLIDVKVIALVVDLFSF
jgi:hypothetical protein